MHLSNRGKEAGLKGSFPSCLTAVNRCIQEISARQDAAPRLWRKQPPVPNSGILKVRFLVLNPAGTIRKPERTGNHITNIKREQMPK
ncbi:hypothetical protein ACMYZ8_09475 [Bacteroides sp. KG156]|uniref:hypothetical protein n=1 Tax=unclassified Bacteroides TaxID=2646097 RepID=UPI003D7F416C